MTAASDLQQIPGVGPDMQARVRCAVYYAESDDHDAELLKWWNWKDRPHANEQAAA